VKVWNAASGKLLGTLREHTDVVESVAWSPDGKRLASSSTDNAKVWDADSGKRLPTGVKGNFVGHKMARTSNGKRLAKCDGHDVVVWGYVKQPANSLQAAERD
jgi:WD40 repeat protein